MQLSISEIVCILSLREEAPFVNAFVLDNLCKFATIHALTKAKTLDYIFIANGLGKTATRLQYLALKYGEFSVITQNNGQ